MSHHYCVYQGCQYKHSSKMDPVYIRASEQVLMGWFRGVQGRNRQRLWRAEKMVRRGNIAAATYSVPCPHFLGLTCSIPAWMYIRKIEESSPRRPTNHQVTYEEVNKNILSTPRPSSHSSPPLPTIACSMQSVSPVAKYKIAEDRNGP